jgi:hypothetical protein
VRTFLKSDGTVVVLGFFLSFSSGSVPAYVPDGLNNVVALGTSSSANHILVIQGQPPSSSTVVPVLNGDNVFNGNVQVNGLVSGNGSGLTNVSAANFTGLLSLTNLPATVVTNTETGVTLGGTFRGNGAGLTNVSAANFTGLLSLTNLPVAALTNTEAGVTLGGTFSGNGAGLTSLNASQLSSGTVPLARLSGITSNQLDAATWQLATNVPANLPSLIASQTFTGINVFTQTVVITNGASLRMVGIGGSSSVATLDLSTYAVGTNPPSARIQALDDGTFGNAIDILTKSDGNITNSLVSRLHINPNGNVGIGTNNPATIMHVLAPGDTEISIQSSDAGSHRWTLQSSGAGTPGLIGSFQVIDRTTPASRLTIFPNGNLLVPGSVTNSGNLTVGGGVRIGANSATVGAESLRILRGEIAGVGTVDFGSGFTVSHGSTGDYVINFSSGFGGTPAVTLTPYGSIVIGTLYIIGSTSAEVKFYNPSGTATDPAGFDFIIIGP